MICPSSLALPHVFSEPSDAAARGIALHAFVQSVLSGAEPSAALGLMADEDDRATAAMIDWDRLLRGLHSVRSEVAYALDVRARTARFLGINVGRQYETAAIAQGAPLGEWEVPGSCDIEGVDSAGRIVIDDIKSGFRSVLRAETNGQLLFFAACRMLMPDSNVDEVEGRIARLKSDGDINDNDRAVYSRFDIDVYLDEYESALTKAKEARALYLAGGVPDVSEGPHCEHCLAFNACPGKTALVRAAVPMLADIDARIAAMTSEDAGAAFEIAHDRIKPVIERVLNALKERVNREGYLPLPGGKKMARSITSAGKPHFSAPLARGLLVQLGANAEQIQRCYEVGAPHKSVRIVNVPKRGRST